MNGGMNLAQARVLLATDRDRLLTARSVLDEMDTMHKSFQAAMRMKIAALEGMLRDNSRDLQLMVGSGINPNDIGAMRHLYATALENTDRARGLVNAINPFTEWTRNVRANIASADSAIQRNIG